MKALWLEVPRDVMDVMSSSVPGWDEGSSAALGWDEGSSSATDWDGGSMTVPDCGSPHSFMWSDAAPASRGLKDSVGSRFKRGKLGLLRPGWKDHVGSRLGWRKLSGFMI